MHSVHSPLLSTHSMPLQFSVPQCHMSERTPVSFCSSTSLATVATKSDLLVWYGSSVMTMDGFAALSLAACTSASLMLPQTLLVPQH